MSDAYREAGVNIDAGEEVVSRIGAHVKRTNRPGVVGGIGVLVDCFRSPAVMRSPCLCLVPMALEPSCLWLNSFRTIAALA